MSPRQVMLMVAASAALLALVAGLMAMPLGLFLRRSLIDLFTTLDGNDTPSFYGVFSPPELSSSRSPECWWRSPPRSSRPLGGANQRGPGLTLRVKSCKPHLMNPDFPS
jgi:hypothetical protein